MSGLPGESVVYVSAIAGKSFPPRPSPVLDQKSLVFQPHILVVQQGDTVDFLNSDNVGHNVFWISVGGNKKLGTQHGYLAEGRKAAFQI